VGFLLTLAYTRLSLTHPLPVDARAALGLGVFAVSAAVGCLFVVRVVRGLKQGASPASLNPWL
jgi:hypothetical protein